MGNRIQAVTGIVTTAGAGVLLAGLALAAFGPTPTLLIFAPLALFASAAQRAISRQR
jgi:hypothetical protein